MASKILSLNSKETSKANLFFIFSLLSQLLEIIFGFIIVKLTISLYGEPINGLIRFFVQIFSYIMLMVSSLWSVFSVKAIQYYKNNDLEKLFWLNNYIKDKFRILSLIYLIISIAIAPLLGLILSANNIDMVFVMCLFLSLSIRPYLTLFIYGRYAIHYSSINKGYIPVIISTLVKSLIFGYVLLILSFFNPKLVMEVDPKTGVEILTFLEGSNKIYTIVVAMGIYSLSPLFAGIIMSMKYKHDYINHPLFKTHGSSLDIDYAAKIKKDIWQTMKYNIILSISVLIVSNTDEFVMLMLRDKNNYNYILKIIGIYGLYISILISLKSIIMQYINSKIVLIGITISNKAQNNKLIKQIREDTYILGLLFLGFSIIIVPLMVNMLFNPTSEFEPYFNTRFSLPIGLLFMLSIFYQPNYIWLQVDNNFKILSFLSLIEGVINIVLSISLIKVLGIYWVLWASVIACAIKLVLFEYLVLFKYKKYSSHFNFMHDKTSLLSFALIVVIIQMIVINTVPVDILKNILDKIVMFSAFWIEIIITSSLWWLSFQKKKYKFLKYN